MRKLGLVLLFSLLFAPLAVIAQQAAGEEKSPPKKLRIAVIGFRLTGMSEAEGELVANKPRSELVRSAQFDVMTRDQIEALIDEQALGQTLVEAAEAARAGKMKGVEYVVTGSLVGTRGAYQATFEMINAETGKILRSITPRVYRGDLFDFLDDQVPIIADQLVPGIEGAVALVFAGNEADAAFVRMGAAREFIVQALTEKLQSLELPVAGAILQVEAVSLQKSLPAKMRDSKAQAALVVALSGSMKKEATLMWQGYATLKMNLSAYRLQGARLVKIGNVDLEPQRLPVRQWVDSPDFVSKHYQKTAEKLLSKASRKEMTALLEAIKNVN